MIYSFDPDWTVCPGEMLSEWMDENNMSLRVLATACGRMPPELLQGVLEGKQEVTEGIALGLMLGTGISATFWKNLEKIYRNGLAAGKHHSHDAPPEEGNRAGTPAVNK